MVPILLQAAPRLDPIELVFGASTVVKLVILTLATMSIVSWFVMGTKAVRLFSARRESVMFLDVFWTKSDGGEWSPERMEGIYAALGRLPLSPLARVFHAGYVELARVQQSPGSGDLENVERALRRTTTNEMTRLEDYLPFLATTGSVGPFIGLFGTVWGIMDSFLAIGAERGATLDVVAPGIAEALIATAIGLAAAIPAVMAYNYFVRRIRVLEAETEAFASDYLNIVRRHFLR